MIIYRNINFYIKKLHNGGNSQINFRIKRFIGSVFSVMRYCFMFFVDNVLKALHELQQTHFGDQSSYLHMIFLMACGYEMNPVVLKYFFFNYTFIKYKNIEATTNQLAL